MKKRNLFLLCLLSIAGILLTGCFSTDDESSVAEAEEVAERVAKKVIIHGAVGGAVRAIK